MIELITRYKLTVILLIAIVARLAFLVILAPTLNFEAEGNAIHGSESYDAYAQNLLATGVYGLQAGTPDAIIPPFYSYTLAVVYGILGRGFVQVGLFHIVLDLLSIALLYDIGRRLFKYGEWVGAGAGLAFALYPYLIFQNLTLVDTALWMTLLHAFVWILIILRDRDHLNRVTLAWGIAGGIILGIATLTRPITPPLALLGALWFLFRLNFRQAFLRLLPVAIISALFVGGWIARNMQMLGEFIPMTTTSGSNLWQGNSEWTVPVFRAGYDVQWTSPQLDPALNEREADAERFRLSTAYWQDLAQNDPASLFELFWVKFLVHWSIPLAPLYNPQPGEQWRLEEGALVIYQADSDKDGLSLANISYDSGLLDTVGRPVHTLYFGGLLLLALVGMVLSRTRWREVSLIILVQISMTLIYMVFHPSTRYRAPSDPLLFLFSAYACVIIAQWAWHRVTSRPLTAS